MTFRTAHDKSKLEVGGSTFCIGACGNEWAVFKIKDALCTWRTHFGRRAHNFEMCAPGKGTICSSFNCKFNMMCTSISIKGWVHPVNAWLQNLN